MIDSFSPQEIQSMLDSVKTFIINSIEKHYPFKVSDLADYDYKDEALIGVFSTTLRGEVKLYSFYIERSDGLPMLKPLN